MNFSILSTFLILIPIAVGILNFNKTNELHQFFVFFLCYGFATDFAILLKANVFTQMNYAVYPIVEVVFYLFYIKRSSLRISVNKWFAPLILICIVTGMWMIFKSAPYILSHQEKENFLWAKTLSNSLYAIILSSLAADSILSLTKNRKSLVEICEFWFLLGIFQYFFCSQLIFNLIFTKVLHSIWNISIVFNILTYLIFTIGFLVTAKTPVLGATKS